MKNKVVKLRTCLLICVICILSTITIMASPTMEKIVAYLNYGINIVIDGEVRELTDANGNRVYPISYEGTTYLPVRGISEILGFKVDWDGKTGSVLIDTQYENRESLITDKDNSTLNSYILRSLEDRTIDINGEQFIADNGIACKLVSNQDYQAKNYVSLALKETYSSVSFDCFAPVSCSVNILNQNGRLVKTVYLKPNVLTHYNFALTNKDNSLIYFVCVNQSDIETSDNVYILNIYGEKN